MQAITFHDYGDADVLKLEDVTTPEPKPGHVLIKVLAAGVNRLDHYIRSGAITQDLPLPHVLGADAVGEVAEPGAGVTNLKAGARVIVVPGFPTEEADYDIYPASLAPSFTLPGLGQWGGYAQFLEVPARFVVKDDTGLRPEEAATLPVVLATSVRAVKEAGQVRASDRVLVQAGASGSGSMQIQVAKALGAEVATTIRHEGKRPLVESLGADLVINATEQDLVEAVSAWTDGKGADVVIDNLGGDVLANSIKAAKPGGIIVAYGFAAGPEVTFDVRDLFFPQKRLVGTMASDATDLEWGLEQVRAGRIKPVLDRALPLSEAAEAHRLVADNKVQGNIVLLPWAA
ncbi:MAG: quinone oxidoreductase family protein [Methyloligellaceae bacterium]